jgi:hypothetical protein
MSVTLSLPQRGRHPKGSIPLTPGIPLLFLGFSLILLRIYHNMRMQCGGGRGSRYPGFRRVPKIKKQ